MYCPKCGNEIPDGSSFCMKCGNKIEVVGEAKETGKADTKLKGETKKANPKKIFIGVIVAIIAIALIKALVGGIGNGSGKVKLGKYKASEDLTVIGSVITDRNYTVIAVENIGDKTVRDYTVAFVGFDSAGNAIKLDGDNWYRTGSVQSANILPGDTYGLDTTFYGATSDVKYTDATISEITFTDGTVWAANNIESWAKDATDSFSVEEYKNKVEGMKALSIQAESNPYVKITKTEKFNDNMFSNKDDLNISYKNIGTQDIRTIDCIIMEYDINGYAVNVSPYSYVTINCRTTSFPDANLVAGGTCGGNNSLFFEGNCASYKVLITGVEFMDGTKWTNNNTFQWILYNENERKD